jgi:hypothetical protein
LKLVECSRRGGALTGAGQTTYCVPSPFWCIAALGVAQFRNSGSGSLSIAATWLTGKGMGDKLV